MTVLLLGAITLTVALPTATATDADCGDPLRGAEDYATCRLADEIDHAGDRTSDEFKLVNDMYDAAETYLCQNKIDCSFFEIPPPQ